MLDRLNMLFDFSEKINKFIEFISNHVLFKLIGFVFVFFVVFRYANKIFSNLLSLKNMLLINTEENEELEEKIKICLKKIEKKLDKHTNTDQKSRVSNDFVDPMDLF